MAMPKVQAVGRAIAPYEDAYHWILTRTWTRFFTLVALAFVGLNAVFAGVYSLQQGAIRNAEGFADRFFFSVQTLGTIGYGSVYPLSRGANLIVVCESVTGLLVTALATGLVFSKFARSSGRMVFSRQVVISPVDGVPTLQLRLGNERGNRIIDSHIRIVLARTETTLEGVTLYRMYDLTLIRERMPVLTRSWTAMHKIVPGSPLYGKTPEDLQREEVELNLTLIGIDDTSMQQVHAIHRYMDSEIVWGARYADILQDVAPDHVILDLRKFHDIVATRPTEDFPYPKA